MKFETPPDPNTRHRGRPVTAYIEEAAELRNHPGIWGIVSVATNRQQASQLAYHINRGKYGAFRGPGTYTAVSRTVDDEHRVYAKYTGPDDA